MWDGLSIPYPRTYLFIIVTTSNIQSIYQQSIQISYNFILVQSLISHLTCFIMYQPTQSSQKSPSTVNTQYLKQIYELTHSNNRVHNEQMKKQQAYDKDKEKDKFDKFVQDFYKIIGQCCTNKGRLTQFIIQQMKKKNILADGQSYGNYGNYGLMGVEYVDVGMGTLGFGKQNSQKCRNQFLYFRVDSNIYIFNKAFVPRPSHLIPNFIFSELTVENIMGYVNICLAYKRIIKCFMPRSLWEKIKPIFQLIWGPYVFQVLSCQNLLLFPEEKVASFDFLNSTIMFRKNLWIWDSFDVILCMKGQKYRVQCSGVHDDDILYLTWRKGLLDQPQYCRLIDKKLMSDITWQSSTPDKFHKLTDNLSYYISATVQLFHNFVQCEIFTFVDDEIIKQLYLSGEIIEYQQGQILYKESTSIDRIFVVLDGQVLEQSQNGSDSRLRDISQFMFLQVIVADAKNVKTTLKIQSKQATIYSISINKFRYILGHYIDTIKHINQFQINHMIGLQKMGFSQWMQKCIQYDSMLSNNLTETTTKTFSPYSIKISNSCWKKICSKNLQILYQTHDSRGSKKNK